MPDPLLERLNRYKLASGRGWRQIARELGLPDQTLLRWLSGGGAPIDVPPDDIDRRLRSIEESARAPRPEPSQPPTPAEPVPAPDIQFRELDLPALAEAAGAVADAWIAHETAPRRSRAGAVIVPIVTGLSALDDGLGGLPSWCCLHGGTRAERRAAALAIAAGAVSRRADQSVLLMSPDLAEQEWARLWLLLHIGLREIHSPPDLTERLETFLATEETLLERVGVLPASALDKREPRALAAHVLRETATARLLWIVDEPGDSLLARLAQQMAHRDPGATPSPAAEANPTRTCMMVLLPEAHLPPSSSWPLSGTVEREPPTDPPDTEDPPSPVSLRIHWQGDVWLAPAAMSRLPL